ncbi:MAG: hypothetical protein VB081_05765, partial [Christensenella sp.]|uniref:hypothetical protein n=1 Tax=Christensenella sp. TaxID=1935934 RepID=UPI002B21CA16
SKVFDNRIRPVLYTLVLAFVWALMTNVMNLLAVNSFVQDMLVRLPFVVGMAVLAYFTSEWQRVKKITLIDASRGI